MLYANLTAVMLVSSLAIAGPVSASHLRPKKIVRVETEQRVITTDRGSFSIHLISLRKSDFMMMTESAQGSDCETDCATKSLQTYIQKSDAVAGINGTYFCPSDYSPCKNNINSFDPPIFDTKTYALMNERELPYLSGPMIAQADDGEFYYYHRTIDFGSVDDFEKNTGKRLQSAISNYPSLIEDGKRVVQNEPVQARQKTKGVRGGIGYDRKNVYLVIAQSASVYDLAAIFDALGATHAMNLDGGGSAALYANGAYQFGPGRALPNAVMFKKRK